MKNIINISLSVIIVILIPQYIFSWGEGKHTMDEVLILRMHLDTNYVFCGSDASWGTNEFGLFVFDRKSEIWTNYSGGNGFPTNSVQRIERERQYVIVTFWQGIYKFDLTNLRYEKLDKEWFEYVATIPRGSFLKVANKAYNLVSDSIIVSDGKKEKVYTPSEALYSKIKENPWDSYSFSCPTYFDNKIYFAFNQCNDFTPPTIGIGSFDIEKKSFHFYHTAIFAGYSASSSFIHNQSIIFPTASFPYEGNEGPAVGFVEFSLVDTSFKIWRELPLPDYPLAIFCVEQDSMEWWIGTDKGAFRINKKTGNSIHYGIRKGITSRDGVNVYSYFGDLDGGNQFPVVSDLTKRDTIELVGIYDQWCEIKAPIDFFGWISKSDVKEIIEESDDSRLPKKIRLEPHVEVKYSDTPNANNLLIEGDYEYTNNKINEYNVVGAGGKNDVIKTYKIKIPTAWVYSGNIIFCMSEIK